MTSTRRWRLVVSAAAILGAAGPTAHGEQPRGSRVAELRPVGTLELSSSTHESTTLERLADDRAVFRDGDGRPIEPPFARVIAWGRCPPFPLGPHVLFTDGGIVSGALEAFDGTTATIRSPSLGVIQVPAAAVDGMRRSAASRPAASEREAGGTAVAEPGGGWHVLLVNGDRLHAESLLVRGGAATVRWRGRQLALPLERVQSLTRSAAARPSATPAARVALDDGSRFPLTEPALAAAARVAATDLVVAVEGSAATRLAAETPTAVATDAPPAGPAFTRGRTLAGDWPSALGNTGFDGLGIRAGTRVRYRLPWPARRFEALVAIDDTAPQDAAATIMVTGLDAEGAPREVFRSPPIRAGDAPLPVRVDLAGCAAVELAVATIVESGDEPPRLAGSVWLDPRAIPME